MMSLCEQSHNEVLDTISIEDSDDDVLFVETDTESVVPSTFGGDGESELDDDDIIRIPNDGDDDAAAEGNVSHVALDEAFVCGGCFSSFARSAALAEHVAGECAMRKTKAKGGKARSRFRDITRRGEPAFGCEQCAYFGRTLGKLRNHVKKQHTLDKTFQCPRCFLSFSWKTHLLKHMYKVHFEYIASMPMQLVEVSSSTD